MSRKDYPNIVVAGPVPGRIYQGLVKSKNWLWVLQGLRAGEILSAVVVSKLGTSSNGMC